MVDLRAGNLKTEFIIVGYFEAPTSLALLPPSPTTPSLGIPTVQFIPDATWID